MRRVLGTLAVAAALVVAPAAPAVAADPAVMTMGTALDVSTKREVKIALHCTSTKACSGTVQLTVGGAKTSSESYSVKAGQQGSEVLDLSKTQYTAVTTDTPGTLVLTEKKPASIKARSISVTVSKAGVTPTPTPTPTQPTPTPTQPTPTPGGTVESEAYKNRNWSPTTYDTCPASLHKKHSVIGPDAKLYPTWHAPTDKDPATGKTCSYGHEHGDDPSTSDIYTWVTDFLDATPSKSRGVPFGYVSEALTDYATEHEAVTRHEDNVGHKLIVANNVKLVTANPRGYLKSGGETVTCDFLIKIHQGTHSGDALINNAHELLYAARCTDGTALITSTMTRFGDANEFNRSCDRTLVPTSGSNLPDGFGGARLIPDKFCVDRDVLVPANRTSSIWALYEVWESVNKVVAADGTTLASFDPWFGVRNPARAHAGGLQATLLDLVDTIWMVDPADSGTAHGYPWDEVDHGTHLAKADPASPFDGAQRDYYLHATTLNNATSTTTWYATPYGEDARATTFKGAVKQYVSKTDNRAWPDLERRSFNLEKDYGKGNGVHAPN